MPPKNHIQLCSAHTTTILALILSTRCQAHQATIQLLRKLYELTDENQVKYLMPRLASCLTASEKEWLSQLI